VIGQSRLNRIRVGASGSPRANDGNGHPAGVSARRNADGRPPRSEETAHHAVGTTALFARPDFDYYSNPDNGHTTRSGPAMQNVFEDSIAPAYQAGQTVLWEDHYDIDANLRLEAAPGHTPGSAVMTLRSGTDRAVFVGDLLHTPMQILDPSRCICFDEDEPRARATRRRTMGSIADETALMLPAHVPRTGALEIRRDGDNFAIKQWAAAQSCE
jgi:glyoxylase-like metal-dependent hydrolase (beta-lactamase superfamily II)